MMSLCVVDAILKSSKKESIELRMVDNPHKDIKNVHIWKEKIEKIK